MGLFDNLVKNVVKNAIGEEEANKLGDKIKELAELAGEYKEAIENAVEEVSAKAKEIPSDYTHFPAFNKPVDSLSTKNESRYQRCTMDITTNQEEVDTYISRIESLGYRKMTNVRYEKDNEYIIVEFNEPKLHLVFHIRY